MGQKYIYFSGTVLGSYRAQNMIKSSSDLGCDMCHISPRFFLFDCKIGHLRPILKAAAHIIFFPIKLYLISRSHYLILLPMNFSWACMLDVFIARIFQKQIMVDFYISMFDTLVNDRGMVNSQSATGKILFFKDRFLLQSATKVFFLNQAESDYYTSIVNITLPAEKICIIPLCIDPKNTISSKFSLGTKNRMTICWWGTYIPLHGLDKIIEAIGLLKDEPIELILIGDSDINAEPFRHLIRQLGLEDKIEIRNDLRFSDGTLGPFLENNCDLALGNFGDSVKAKTVLVNKVVDALAMGLACLTFKTKGAAEFLEDGKDIFFSEATPVAIANKIKTIFNNKKSIDTVGIGALQTYHHHFSQDAFRTRLHGALNQLR